MITAPNEEVDAKTETPMKIKTKSRSKKNTLSTSTHTRSGVLSPRSDSAFPEI